MTQQPFAASRIALVAGIVLLATALLTWLGMDQLTRVVKLMLSPDGAISERTGQAVFRIPLVLGWWGLGCCAYGIGLSRRADRTVARLIQRAGIRRGILLGGTVAGLVALNCVVMLVFPFPPFQDLPTHLYLDHVIRQLQAGDGFYAYFFDHRSLPVPYLLAPFVVRTLAPFLGYVGSAKVCIAAYLVLFPVSVYIFLRRNGSLNAPLLTLVPLLSINYFLLMGNLNFILSFPIFFFAVTAWYHAVERPTMRTWFAAGALFLTLYFTHLFSFLLAIWYTGWAGLFHAKRWRRVGATALAFLPGVLLFLVLAKTSPPGGGIHFYASLGDKIGNVLRVMWWRDFIWERILLLGPGLVLAALLGWGLLRRESAYRVQKAGFVSLLAVFLFSPAWIGQLGFPDQRLIPIALCCGLPLICLPRALLARGALAAFFAAGSIAWALHAGSYNAYDNVRCVPIAQRLSTLPPRCRVLPIPVTGEPAFFRFAHYYGVSGNGILPGLFTGAFHGLYPRVNLPGAQSIERVGPDHAAFYDYVLVIGPHIGVDLTVLEKMGFVEKLERATDCYREFGNMAVPALVCGTPGDGAAAAIIRKTDPPAQSKTTVRR